jgi:hypothetical protein
MARTEVSHAPSATTVSSGDWSNRFMTTSAVRAASSARSALRPTQNRASAARLGMEPRRSIWGRPAVSGRDQSRSCWSVVAAGTHTSLAHPWLRASTGTPGLVTRPMPPGRVRCPWLPEIVKVRTTAEPGLSPALDSTGVDAKTTSSCTT